MAETGISADTIGEAGTGDEPPPAAMIITEGPAVVAAPAGVAIVPPAPKVLELRVHGVNNTTPAALLDVPADSVELISGDKLGSFWRSTAIVGKGRRGYVPPEIVREAYSWGGMVRTTPQFGGTSLASKLAAVGARVVYALIIPFSIGNAVIWSRRITQPGDSKGRLIWIGITAGIARVFGLILTLLFTATLVTLAIDVGALQCAADPSRCQPLKAVFEPMAGWSPGQRVALLALVPIAGIAALWVMSAVSRLRYDVLPGMEDNNDNDVVSAGPDEGADAAADVDAEPAAPPLPPPAAVLSIPGFWSNRITRHLARAHLAAAIALVAAFCAGQGSLGWRTTCESMDLSTACLSGPQDGWFTPFAVLAGASLVLLVAAAGLVAVLPTMTIEPEEQRDETWPNWTSLLVLGLASVVLAVILVMLAFGPTAPLLTKPGAALTVDRLYGAGNTPLFLVVLGGLCALSGLFWRPAANRWQTAWSGCAPAVFMILALSLAVATCAIVVVMVGDWLNGSKGPTALLGWQSDPLDLQVSSSFVALGAVMLIGVVIALLIALVLAALPKNVSVRAKAWGAPPEKPVPIPDGGVLPPSADTLLTRIQAKRNTAARLHLVEPVFGVIATILGVALIVGAFWTWWATAHGETLWQIGPNEQFLVNVCDIGMLGLATVGTVLVGILATGAGNGSSRPLGIVWDIACYLPQTGHPFGPPCYAQRAVPEIAGRLNAWLRNRPDRRAVLAAHSMGGVLAVSSLGLLASVDTTRRQLGRISLLTFGIQLRPFFGRMLPELLGPTVLGIHPARPPHVWGEDPWRADFAGQVGVWPPPTYEPTQAPATGRLDGTLVGDGTKAGTTPVTWVSLWRATDFLGFPVMSTATNGASDTWRNAVDRYAEELDTSGYMLAVGTHGEYYRVKSYDDALRQLADI